MDKRVSIIGGGLSGCEAALVLAQNGFQVILYDKKPSLCGNAYVLPSFAELICNNVLAPNDYNTPLGLLVSELRLLKSPLIQLAGSSCLRDSAFLAVNKKLFSQQVTNALQAANVKTVCDQVTSLSSVDTDTVILATGPLTNNSIVESVSQRTKTRCFHFSDASSIVVDIRSVDIDNRHFSKVSDDLYLVKLEDSEFRLFYKQLIDGTPANAHINEDEIVFKECQSIENIAKESANELISRKFTTTIMPGICFLMRRENGLENGFILSGFMSTLRHADQKRAIMTLPGFTNVKILKYGRSHRNTYFDSPKFLDCFYKVNNQNLYIIGQLSGVDGYVPCISSGYVAAQRIIREEGIKPFPKETMIGALAHYVSNKAGDYTPMGPSFSLLQQDASRVNCYYSQSMRALKSYLSDYLV